MPMRRENAARLPKKDLNVWCGEKIEHVGADHAVDDVVGHWQAHSPGLQLADVHAIAKASEPVAGQSDHRRADIEPNVSRGRGGRENALGEPACPASEL